MARIVGRRGGLWVFGLLASLVLAPLAVFVPLAGAFALAAIGLIAAVIGLTRASTLTRRCEKLSDEVDILSKRLLSLESAPGGRPRTQAAPQAETADLSAGVEEVTAEIGLLSGIVRELAAIVAAQDGDLARLKADQRPAPVPVAPAAAMSAPEIVVQSPRPAPIVPAAPVVMPWTPRPLDRPAAEEIGVREAGVQEVGGRAGDPRPAADRPRESALVAAFEGEGLEVHLQPVVSLPQRKVVSYEAVARLRLGGEILTPEQFLPVLERHGRTTDLDRRMLQRVATIGRHLGGRGSNAAVAYALSPFSLFEPGFLRSLSRLVGDEPGLAGRLVVALPQASWRSLDAEQAGALSALRGQLGFILDRPVDLRFDPLALAERGIGQVKVPAEMILRPSSRKALPDIALEDLVAALTRAGIRVVADRIEHEADVPDLIDLGIPLAQGALFAPARAVRAEVLAAPVPSAAPEPEPAPQRRPFRDFLRRAG